jgi:hypothetical protein
MTPLAHHWRGDDLLPGMADLDFLERQTPFARGIVVVMVNSHPGKIDKWIRKID